MCSEPPFGSINERLRYSTIDLAQKLPKEESVDRIAAAHALQLH